MILWPHPRLNRIQAHLRDTSTYETLDGLSYLSHHGVQPLIWDPTRPPWNPWTTTGSTLVGVDPLRSFRLLANSSHFDVLVAIETASAALFVAARRLLHLKKPVVVIDPALDPTFRNRERLQAQVLPYCDRVIVYGRVQEEYLRNRYAGAVCSSFVRHRIDCSFFQPSTTASAQPYLLSVGNDVGRDFETLVAAAEGLPCRLVLHTSRRLPAQLPPNIEQRSGWISYEELRAMYAGASAVIVPLRNTIHASGVNGLLEAMAMGKPVIVSLSQGLADYVQHGETAWTVEPGDPAALRQAIVDLQHSPELAARLGANARAFCLRECSMPVYAESIAAILHQVCGPPGARTL